MFRKLFTLAVLFVGLTLANVGTAQHRHHGHYSGCNVGRGSYYGGSGNVYGYGYAGGGYGAMSYEESVIRGMAAYTRAVGEANYLHAQAATQWQQARTQQLNNEKLKTETYFKKQEIYTANLSKRSRLSPEGYAKLAMRDTPARLNETHYNRVTGRLFWPTPLLGDAFLAERNLLEAAFAARSPGDVGVGTPFQTRISAAVDVAQQKLKKQVHVLKPQQFIAAKNFLTSLAYESEQSIAVTTLAAVK